AARPPLKTIHRIVFRALRPQYSCGFVPCLERFLIPHLNSRLNWASNNIQNSGKNLFKLPKVTFFLWKTLVFPFALWYTTHCGSPLKGESPNSKNSPLRKKGLAKSGSCKEESREG
ncbi:MAG: hypothetical protein IKH30_03310, partial [Clostridia bacterium]|nr:hypothetical protein [Clostridia bacterium]